MRYFAPLPLIGLSVAALALAATPGLAQPAQTAPSSATKKPEPRPEVKKPEAKKPDAKKPDTKKPDAKADAPKPKPAAAATSPTGGPATLLGTFGDWGAYTAQTGRTKICYALSQPKARQPANLANTPGYLFVSFRPAENVRNEVALVMGFPTKEGGDAEATIGTTNYALVTKGSNAWVKNPAEEAQVIATMAKGQAMVVKATSARNNPTSDRYSLGGFSQALERAKKECP
jgi:hypothetical protein